MKETCNMMQTAKALRLLSCVTMILLVSTTSSASFCGKLGSFDAMCLRDDAVFILSVSPCHSFFLSNKIDRTVYLTIINTRGRMKKYDMIVQKSIQKPQSFGRNDVGFLLEMHYHSGGSSEGHLHVDLALGNFTDNGIHSKKTLLDIYFYVENAGFCYGGFSGASFYPAPACQESKRTGNLSTLCITRPSTSIDKTNQGIFFVSLDPCTSPISYWVVALFPGANNTQVIERYTGSKTDVFVPVENASCGFKVNYRQDHSEFFTVMITLSYGCSDATAVHVINDYYFPDSLLTCPPARAKCKSITPYRRICSSRMLVDRMSLVNLTFDVQLSGCEEKYNVFVVATMDGVKNKLYLNFKDPQHWLDFKFDGKNRTTPTQEVIEPIKSGFIPKFGGYISVMSERVHFEYDDFGASGRDSSHSSVTAAYLGIERMYGKLDSNTHLLAPLVFEDFTLPSCGNDRKRSLSGHATLSNTVKAVIALSVVAVVAAIIGFVFYWRRNRSKGADGLPYQIELNYDGEEENDL